MAGIGTIVAMIKALGNKTDQEIAQIEEDVTDVKTAIDGINNSLNSNSNKITDLERETNTLFNPEHTSLFEVGSFNAENGDAISSTTRIRTGILSDGVTAVIPDNGYKFMLLAYKKSDNSYEGTWDGTKFVKRGVWLTTGLGIPNNINGEHYYKLLVSTINNDTVTLATDAKHIRIVWGTDITLTKLGLSADAKIVGDLFNEYNDIFYYVSTNERANYTDYIFDISKKGEYQLSAADFEEGSYDTSNMKRVANSKRLRTRYLLPVTEDMKINYSNPNLDLNIFVFASKEGSILQTTGWINAGGSGTVKIDYAGFMVVLLNGENNITINDYSGEYSIVYEERIENNPLFFYKSYNHQSIPVGSSALSYGDFITNTWEAFRTAFSNNVSRNVLTNDTSDTFPIYEYIVTPSEYYTHTVLIAAGMHGDEYESFWSLYRIINFLYTVGYKYEKTRDMFRNTKFIVIPALNPYGVEHRTRENSAGVNAHDNYDVRWSDNTYTKTGTTPFQYNEPKALKLALEAHNDIDMFIEFHTDPYSASNGNYIEVIETSSLVPMAYNITLDERQNLKNDYNFVDPLSKSWVIMPTRQCNSIRYAEEVWDIPAILIETGIGGAASSGTAKQMEIAFNWYINCMIQAIKTLDRTDE